LSAAGVGDQDAEAAAPFGDRGVERVEGGQVGDIAHDTDDLSSMPATAASTTSFGAL
jgi:hypothetical protein